jgi:hypothetical protein
VVRAGNNDFPRRRGRRHQKDDREGKQSHLTDSASEISIKQWPRGGPAAAIQQNPQTLGTLFSAKFQVGVPGIFWNNPEIFSGVQGKQANAGEMEMN